MREITITPMGKGQFRLRWVEAEGNLDLDFRPFIERAKKRGCRYLIHWQAKPKGIRRWGIYDIESDAYVVTKSLDVIGTSHGLQIDENKVKTVPTAVLMADEVKCKGYGSMEVNW